MSIIDIYEAEIFELNKRIGVLERMNQRLIAESNAWSAEFDDRASETIANAELVVKLMEENKELKSLVDGALDVVMLFPANSQAIREWKERWIGKARILTANSLEYKKERI